MYIPVALFLFIATACIYAERVAFVSKLECAPLHEHGYKLHVLIILFITLVLSFFACWLIASVRTKAKLLRENLQLQVNELKKTADALHLNESVYSATLLSIGDAVISTDVNGCVMIMNKVAERLTGWKQADAAGKKIEEVFCIRKEATGEVVSAPVHEVLEAGKIIELENHIVLISKDGLEISVADSAAPIRNSAGEISGVVLVFRDQTSEGTIAKKLEASESHYRSLFDNMPGGFGALKVIFDDSGEPNDYYVEQMNPSLEKMTDIKEEDALGKTFSIILPSLNKGWKDFFDHVAKTRESTVYEAYANRFKKYYYAVAFSPEPGRIAFVLNDVSIRKKAQDELEESKRFLRLVIDTLPIRIFWKDLKSTYLGCNLAFAKDAGFDSSTELVGLRDFDMSWADQNAEAFRADDREVMETGIPKINYEEPQQRENGKINWLETSKLPLNDSDGNCIGVLGAYEDITEIRREHQQLQQLFAGMEQTPDAVVVTDLNGNIEYVNPAFVAITGYSENEILGQNPRILKSGEHPESYYKELWDTISSGENWFGHFINKTKSGRFYTDESIISPIKDDKGVVLSYVAIKRDVTNELIREQKLQEAEKMESIGILAGGIAHQFNNLLQSILGHSELLAFDVEGKRSAMKSIRQIQESTNRAAELTKELLTFSRQDFMHLNEYNFNEIVITAVDEISKKLNDSIDLQVSLCEESMLVFADERQLKLLISNILENAVESMVVGGDLIVKTFCVSISKEEAEESPNALPGNFVCCSIQDSGTGMLKEIKEHIFDPFYSTKDMGVGLGLASAYGIIQKHNGWIDVESELAKGSKFSVYIPSIVKNSMIFS
ncbi:MAG: PAS domain S-box protein [Kiritimatiellae bacterium]|nr:PAS domain S-box protein [Kiritimatiellia bacterium]